MAEHYARSYDVQLDSEQEVVVTIGAKEGIAHLMLALLDAGDTVLVPTPAYPIRLLGGFCRWAGANPSTDWRRRGRRRYSDALLAGVEEAVRSGVAASQSSAALLLTTPPLSSRTGRSSSGWWSFAGAKASAHPRLRVCSFRVQTTPRPAFCRSPARRYGGRVFADVQVVLDGWLAGRVLRGNSHGAALTKVKNYTLTRHLYQPIRSQLRALRCDQSCVTDTRETYRRRRDALIQGLRANGWPVPLPAATMFAWAPLPDRSWTWARWNSPAGCSRRRVWWCLRESGLGPTGRGVRFALIQDEERLREAADRIGGMLRSAA